MCFDRNMEIGMLNFWLGLLVTALMKETYFIKAVQLSWTSKNWIMIIFDAKNSKIQHRCEFWYVSINMPDLMLYLSLQFLLLVYLPMWFKIANGIRLPTKVNRALGDIRKLKGDSRSNSKKLCSKIIPYFTLL